MLSKAFSVVLAMFMLVSPASALVVRYSPGGLTSQFYQQEMQLEARGEGVTVTGRCASACTIFLHNPRVCVSPSGSFMFHQAFEAPYGPGGPHVQNLEVSAALMSVYPPGVQAWIRAHGGLTPNPLIMSAQQAWAAGVRRC
jgi:hypothetical protein